MRAASGVAASSMQLPSGKWATVLDFLCARFPAIARVVWLDRMSRGLVVDDGGAAINPERPFRTGLVVRYFREVTQERPIPFDETVLHIDDDLLVADKPHFLPVTPSGRYVEQTLLARLIRRTGNRDLVPLHRIDRATAGLVLFSMRPQTRAQYQAMFRERNIEKRYLALAGALPDTEFPVARHSRLVRGSPFFCMQEANGQANAFTRIDALQRDGAVWRYALQPITGKKHQLRVHMAALGATIVGDTLYPKLTRRAEDEDDFAHPLKLLARSLAFEDPLTGAPRRFVSEHAL